MDIFSWCSNCDTMFWGNYYSHKPLVPSLKSEYKINNPFLLTTGDSFLKVPFSRHPEQTHMVQIKICPWWCHERNTTLTYLSLNPVVFLTWLSWCTFYHAHPRQILGWPCTPRLIFWQSKEGLLLPSAQPMWCDLMKNCVWVSFSCCLENQ